MSIKRRSNITARFNKMRGLEPEEKRVFTRIGELVDAVINNRAPTNPGSQESRIITRTDVSLPPVKNLTVQTGVRSAKIGWDPVNSSFLQFYEIRITEEANGDQTTGIAYSNTFTIKDKEGNFFADVRSVGRDGTASTFSSIVFEIQPNIILYNGIKNATDELGWTQITPIYCPKGYNVFFWSSMVLNSFSDPDINNNTEINLSVGNAFYSGGDYYLFNNFIQTVTGFGEEVTFTNLSVSAGGGSTNRPGGAPTRTATFQTTKAHPYIPYAVPDVLGDRVNTFFISERQRDDVLGLSLNAWVTTAGTAVVTGFVGTTNSLEWNSLLFPELRNTGSNNIGITTDYTVAFWVKFKTETIPPPDYTLIWNNSLAFTTFAGFSVGIFKTIDSFNSSLNQIQVDFSSTTAVIPALIPITLDIWHLYVTTYTASTKTLNFYMDGVFQGSSTSALYDASFSLTTNPAILSGLFQDSWNGTYDRGVKMFWTAVYNSVLDASNISYLYSGVGASGWNSFDLKTNFGSYTAAANLIHWWRPGDGTLGNDEVSGGISLTGFNINIGTDIIADSPA